jgi:hypothetical protein
VTGDDRRALVSRTLRLDGVFEIALGLLLATSPWTGLHAAMRLPPPAGVTLVVGLGVLLIPVGGWLILLARRWSAPIVMAIAIANAAGAVLFAVWLAASWAQFGAAGRWVIGATALVLDLLAALEWIGLGIGRGADASRAADPR